MSNYFGKMPSSRPIRLNELDWTGSGTLQTTNFSPQTSQVRIVSDVRGYASFGSTSISTSSRGVATVEIFPNLRGEYFVCQGAGFICWSSTSTSSGSVLITEMS
jgi:hypothetical protein